MNLHAHQIRHAKASHWLEDGMNIVQISFLLGHADVKTTMVYHTSLSALLSDMGDVFRGDTSLEVSVAQFIQTFG